MRNCVCRPPTSESIVYDGAPIPMSAADSILHVCRAVMGAAASDGYAVQQAVFIQCFNEPPEEEARWILDLMEAEGSAVCGLVAHIPVPDGAAAVEEFLDSLRGEDGALPAGLKGGRIAFANGVTNPQFLAGLKALGAAGLSWDFCVRAEDIRLVTQAAKQVPETTLILDHFGHGGSIDSEYPIEEWRDAMAELAAACPNVFVKVGSMFTDGDEAARYFDDAIAMFGYERLLAESNWFVGSSDDSTYHSVFTLLMEACDRAGATDEEKAMVFHENARRFVLSASRKSCIGCSMIRPIEACIRQAAVSCLVTCCPCACAGHTV